MKTNSLKINEADNVVIALRNIKAKELLYYDGQKEEITVFEYIPYGHKIAIKDIPENSKVIKYGECMGITTKEISSGHHAHVSNIRGLTEEDKAATIYGERSRESEKI